MHDMNPWVCYGPERNAENCQKKKGSSLIDQQEWGKLSFAVWVLVVYGMVLN